MVMSIQVQSGEERASYIDTRRHASSESDDLLQQLLKVVPRAVVAGSVEAAGGLADVIAFIHNSRWSGVLRATDRGTEREVIFRLGEVCSASSSIRRERLGEILFRYGRVSKKELEAALDLVPHQRLGQALVSQGVLTSADLFAF